MENASGWAAVLTACAPILVALVGIIPTIISNRKQTEKSIAELQRTLDAHIREDAEDQAKYQRYRILRFYDELCEHRKHSESHFEDILQDIDEYELFCQNHKDFKNSRGQAAMDYIKTTYAKVKAKGGFLTHPKEDNDEF